MKDLKGKNQVQEIIKLADKEDKIEIYNNPIAKGE